MDMQVALLYGPEDVRLETRPAPVAGPGEVVVEVKVALTDVTDLKAYRRGGHVMLGKLPSPFGHEFAGVVAQVGSGVTRFRPGMRVVAANSAPCLNCFYCRRDLPNLCEDLLFLNGAYAQYIKVPQRITAINLYELPEHVSFTHAAITEPLACAVHGIDASDIRLGDTVLINGSGAMGLMLCRLAALRGARVIVCDPYVERLEVARRFGAAMTVHVTPGLDQVAAVKALTPDGRGADVAIEAAGLPDLWEKTIALTRKGGLAVMFGGCPHGTTISVDTAHLHYGEIAIKGIFHHTPRYVRQALDLIAAGALDIDALITDTLPLSRLADALSGMAGRRGFKFALEPGK